MLDYACIQENRKVLDENLKRMRIDECPLKCNDNILIMDRLERGFIRIYEYSGGAVDILDDSYGVQDCRNAPLVAWMSVFILPERKEIYLDSVHCEDGYDPYMSIIKTRVLHFADFYGMRFCILNLEKR